ncbi:MAG TPA: tetratricopeptide repeat protein, partial [Polyangiaceae bacterium]|nr:tetratricopeptide repeat protein [Polyangiaceae bacterium]
AAEALGERALLGEALARQGQLEGHLGSVKQGEATLRRAVATADAAGDDDTRARASNSLLFNVGCVQNNNAPLVPFLNDQARSAIARLGGDPGLDGLRAGNFATALLRQGKFDEALREYQAALPLLERAFGPESRQVQGCLNGLGHAQAERGDYEGAWATLRRAVQSSEATLGPQHPEVAAQLNNLATVLEQLLRFDEAEAYFERTLAIQEAALGPQAPSLWLYLNNLGDTLNERAEYARALPLLRRSLSLCEQLGPDFADLLYPLSALGQAHLGLGEHAPALAHLERAVALPTYEEAAPDLAHARFTLAQTLWAAGRDRRRARSLAESARDVLRGAAKSPLGQRRLLAIEQWLERHGQGRLAHRSHRRLLAIGAGARAARAGVAGRARRVPPWGRTMRDTAEQDAERPLAAIFAAALADPARAVDPPPGDLEGALRRALDAGRLAWPGLDLPAEAFVAYVAARLPAARPAAEAVAALHAPDLYLACACARHDPRAIAAFEARYVAELDRALGRLRVEPAIADDVKGVLREKLFFPRGGERPLLAGYSGRGELGAWLRAVAVRAARRTLRPGRDDPAGREGDPNAVAPGVDPELGYLKATFAAESTSALAEAIEALALRERNLLRQYYLDGLNVDQLAKLYRVHRATAARWVADVRDGLAKEVQRRLMQRLRLNERELQSAMRLAHSQFDISIHRLLTPEQK